MVTNFVAKLRDTGNGTRIVTVPAPVIAKLGLESGKYYDFGISLDQDNN